MAIREILTVLCPCSHAQMRGCKWLKINDNHVSTLKQTYSRGYSGTLKLKLAAKGSTAHIFGYYG